MRKILLIGILMTASHLLEAAQLTLVPGGTLWLNPTNPGRNYSDLVLHSVLVSTGPEEEFTVSGMQIDILSDGRTVLSKSVSIERLVGETQGLAQMVNQGMGVFLNAQIHSPQGIEGLFGGQIDFANNSALGPDQLLMLTRQQFSLDFAADALTVTVHGSDASGADAGGGAGRNGGAAGGAGWRIGLGAVAVAFVFVFRRRRLDWGVHTVS